MLIQPVCKTIMYIKTRNLFSEQDVLNALVIINMLDYQYQIMHFEVIIFGNMFQLCGVFAFVCQ